MNVRFRVLAGSGFVFAFLDFLEVVLGQKTKVAGAVVLLTDGHSLYFSLLQDFRRYYTVSIRCQTQIGAEKTDVQSFHLLKTDFNAGIRGDSGDQQYVWRSRCSWSF